MTWTTLVAPVGGRRYMGGDIEGVNAWSGPHGVAISEGVITRFDRARGSASRLAVKAPENVCAAAVSAEGRVAWSDGLSVTFEGGASAALSGVSKLRFGAAGDLWALGDRGLSRIDGRSGAVIWTVDVGAELLDVEGDVAIAARWGRVARVSGDGDVRAEASRFEGAPSALRARGSKAWVVAEHQGERHLSVWDLGAMTETRYRLPATVPIREVDVTRDGVVAWRDAPLGLREFNTRTGETRDLHFPGGPSVGLEIADDDRAWLAVLEWESGVVRVEREAGRERDVEPDATFTLWGLSVADDGRVASAHDGHWRVTAPDGTPLRYERVARQVTDVAFSMDGRRLAVLRTTDEGAVALDLFDTTDWSRRASKAVSASKVAFTPDGARVALVEGSAVTLCDAEDLGVQAILTHTKRDDSLEGVSFSDGRVCSHDSAGRVVAFDDPGALPTSKKPPKFKPALVVATSAVNAGTARASNHAIGAVRAHQGALLAFDRNTTSLVTIDVATKKPVTRRDGVAGYFCLDAPVYVRIERDGCAIHRVGDDAPLARSSLRPTMAACSPDGRAVAIALHGGVYLTRV